jgi:hypothetical protein
MDLLISENNKIKRENGWAPRRSTAGGQLRQAAPVTIARRRCGASLDVRKGALDARRRGELDGGGAVTTWSPEHGRRRGQAVAGAGISGGEATEGYGQN